MRWRGLIPACVLTVLLAGCTTPSPRPVMPPPVARTAQPATASPTSTPVPAPVARPTPEPVSAPAPDTWSHLRARFAMQDCIAPAVHRARRETRNRQRFEARMKALLPVIDYVARVATHYDVAGEFVLLPWVESHFRETPPRHRRPAGMWQIIAVTAHAMDLPTGRHYDGRLDKVASTRAVMRLLARYHKKWHDWRLTDMAYNTGEYRMRRLLKAHGMPPASPVVPQLPVGSTTRHHLIRLLAIACVIRDPQRFHVQLPTLDPSDRLEVVKLPAPARLRQVARLTNVPTDRLRKLNAGYRQSSVSSGTPMQLLLPVGAAQSLREAMAAGLLHEAGNLADTDAPSTYTVASGDSLWGIARRFNLHINQLRQWNDLDGSILQPGQVLQLEAPPSG